MAQQGSGYQARYKRILLKLSGEALMGSEEFGIDPKVLDRMALEVGQLVGIGVQVGLVIGGGNLFRGAALVQPAWIGSPATTWACWPP
jgi:uridylate kinase